MVVKYIEANQTKEAAKQKLKDYYSCKHGILNRV